MEYDLLTQTGHEINDIGRTLSWDALDSFLRFIGPESAFAKDHDQEVAVWSTRMKTNFILADIYDMLAMINSNLIAYASRKPARPPKKYPRPGKKDEEHERRIGSGALPPDELRKWMEEKRESHARSSSGDHNSHASDGGRSRKDYE